MSKRMDRLAAEGGDIMSSVFGDGDEGDVIKGFVVFADGRMEKEQFDSDNSRSDRHYLRYTEEDGDEWLEFLRDARREKRAFTDDDFPPNSESLGEVASLAGKNVQWTRISDMFNQRRYITLRFLDDDERLGDNAGRCFAIDMNLSTEPSNPGQNNESHASYIPLATAIITDALAKRDLTARLWAEGVDYVTEHLKSKIEEFYVQFARVGSAAVRFFRFEKLGTPRVAVCLELVYEMPLKMFDRPEPDEHGVVAALVEPSDINQGLLGDCYYLCGLSILAAHPRLLFDVLPDVPPDLKLAAPEGEEEDDPDDEQEANPEGIYAVRFWRDGAWRIVVVDDYIPVLVTPTSRDFVFASPAKGTAEIWCIICEKCYAKLNGSYAAIEGGNDEIAIEDLCGGVPLSFEMGARHLGKYGGGVEGKELLWRDIKRYRAEHAMLGCSWFAGEAAAGGHVEGKETHIDRGVFANHAYGILACVDVAVAHRGEATTRLIQLRNPHGTGGEFEGEWSDAHASWGDVEKAECDRIGYVDADDGTFFMSIDDFFEMFTQICVCRPLMATPYLSSNWSMWSIKGEFYGASSRGFEAGPMESAQFQVFIDSDVELVCTVSVTSSRVTGQEYPGLLLAVMKGVRAGERSGEFDAATMVGGGGPIHAIANRTSSVEHMLSSRDGPFNVVPMTTAPWEGRYYLRIFTSGPARVVPV